MVLSGGSAFGLAASGGVMRYLEERNIGYETGFAKVPLVTQACIYDLGVGSSKVRPDEKMGYDACLASESRSQKSGPIGAGCGATVGKLHGPAKASRAGLGVYAARLGSLEMGAVVSVNALGDIYNPETGEKVCGMQDGACDEALFRLAAPTDLFNSNTTIACLITNGTFSKAEMSKIASMARAAYARCISPVGTMADGDTIFALSSGEVQSDVNAAGTLAARVLEKAILEAVK